MQKHGINIPFAEPMNFSADPALLNRLFQWAKYLIYTVLIICVSVLAGWLTKPDFFMKPSGGSGPMNPVTSLCFIFFCGAFLFFYRQAGRENDNRFGLILVLLFMSIAVIRLAGLLSNSDWQIDKIFFRNEVGIANSRLAASTAICFLLSGISLFLSTKGSLGKQVLAQLFAIAVFLFALFALLGHIYDVPEFNGSLPFLSMSLPSIVCFLFVALSVLFSHSGEGVFRELASADIGGITFRKLVFYALVIPVILGFLRLLGYWAGWFSTELGVALIVTSVIVVFIPMLWYNTVLLNKRDRERRLTEKKFELLLDAAPDATVVVNDEGIIQLVNRQVENLFGYTRSELIGQKVEILIPQDVRDKHVHHRSGFFKQAGIRPMGVGLELRAIKKDQSSFPVEISLSPIATNEGLLVSASIRDITARKKAEEKFRSLLNAAPDATIIVNDKGLIEMINHQTENLFGYVRNELIGKPVEILIPTNYQGKHQGHRNKYFSDPKVRSMGVGLELFAMRKDGTKFPVEISLSPLATEEGMLVSAAVRDITDRKKAEEKFRSLLEAAPDAMIIANEKGEIVLVNHQTETVFGYGKHELIGKPVEILVPAEFHRKHVGHRNKYFSEPKVRTMGVGLELFATRKDGTQFPVEISLSPLQTEEGMLVSASVRDITDRKKAEEKLKESEENLRILFNSIDEGFCIIEMIFDEQEKPIDYRFLVVNSSFEKQTGLHNAVGKRMREFAPDHEEHWFETYGRIALTGESIRFVNRAEQLHRWYDVYAFRFGEPKNFQVAILFNDITESKRSEELIKKQKQDVQDFIDSMSTLCAKVTTDGTLLMVNKIAIQASGLPMGELFKTNFINGPWWTFDPDVHARVKEAFRKASSGETVTYDENIFVFGQVLTINFSLIPIFKSNNEVDYIVAEGRDITALKITEAALTERTNQLVKLNEELEAFTYSVSHDLRAPLRGIIGFTNILEEDYTAKLDDEAKRITSVIKNNTLKMGHLIDDLLDFSRMGKKEFIKTRVDTMALVKEIINEISLQNNDKIIQWNLGSLQPVNADITTIRQVWINLISNAVKYSAKKDKQRIDIGSTAYDKETVFYVRDNGVGFDESYKHKLFKVFQRLHSPEEFEGTGVGLALIEKIVSRHGGKVWAEGKVNEGACFYFSIPD